MRTRFVVVGLAAAALIGGAAVIHAQRPVGPGQLGPGRPEAAIGQRFGRGGPGAGPMRGGRGFGPMRGGPGMGPEFGRGVPGGFFRIPDLTTEQRDRIRDITDEARKASDGVMENVRAAEKDLHLAVLADTRDAAKVAELGAKVSALRQQIFDAHLKTQLAIADVLTAEQRQALRDRPRR